MEKSSFYEISLIGDYFHATDPDDQIIIGPFAKLEKFINEVSENNKLLEAYRNRQIFFSREINSFSRKEIERAFKKSLNAKHMLASDTPDDEDFNV